ncbi:MAG: DUF4129 domain-containing protein [Planctomycetota bacterium]
MNWPVEVKEEDASERESGKRRQRGGSWSRVSSPLVDLATIIWWLGATVAAVILLLWLFRGLSERGLPGRAVEIEPSAAPRPARATAAREVDFEALAREGRFGEAIHGLLLNLIAKARGLAPHLTSREIVRRMKISQPVRKSLAELVLAVERSHFGGRQAAKADYNSCLEHYRICHRALEEPAA